MWLRISSSWHAQGLRSKAKALLCWTQLSGGAASAQTLGSSECSSTLQHKGSNQQHPTSHEDRMTLWPPSICQLSQMPIILTGGHLSAPGCIFPHSSWPHCAQPQWHGQWTGEPRPAPAPEKQHPTCYCALQLRFFCTRAYGRRDHSTVNSRSLCLGKKVSVTSTKVQWFLQGDQRQSFRTMQQPWIFSLLQGGFEIPLQSQANPKPNYSCSCCPTMEQIHNCECDSWNLVTSRVDRLWMGFFCSLFSWWFLYLFHNLKHLFQISTQAVTATFIPPASQFSTRYCSYNKQQPWKKKHQRQHSLSSQRRLEGEWEDKAGFYTCDTLKGYVYQQLTCLQEKRPLQD